MQRWPGPCPPRRPTACRSGDAWPRWKQRRSRRARSWAPYRPPQRWRQQLRSGGDAMPQPRGCARLAGSRRVARGVSLLSCPVGGPCRRTSSALHEEVPGLRQPRRAVPLAVRTGARIGLAGATPPVTPPKARVMAAQRDSAPSSVTDAFTDAFVRSGAPIWGRKTPSPRLGPVRWPGAESVCVQRFARTGLRLVHRQTPGPMSVQMQRRWWRQPRPAVPAESPGAWRRTRPRSCCARSGVDTACTRAS